LATSYQDVVRADFPWVSHAFTEAAGTDFAPWIGTQHLTSTGTLLYQQTGPFATAFALHLAAAATLRGAVPFGATGPLYVEVWVKLDVYPPTANQFIYFVGNAGGNGYGVFVDTTGALQIYAPPGAAVVTGAMLGSGWHLVTQGGDVHGTPVLAVDGVIKWQGPTPTVVTPSPNQIGWGCDSSTAVARAISLAYPTVYLHAMLAPAVQASFLAATDPAAALLLTSGASPAADTLLQQILAAVRKQY
jgi:hypothetical protein